MAGEDSDAIQGGGVVSAKKTSLCLRCDRVFRPQSRFNRICPRCHDRMPIPTKAELNMQAMRRYMQAMRRLNGGGE